MTRDSKISLELAAYHDGELSWWGRWRVERRLRNSAALRQELDELSKLSEWVRAVESDNALSSTPDFWSEIGPALSQIDRDVASAADGGQSKKAGIERSGFGKHWNWGSLAATGAIAMLVLAVLIEVDPALVDAPGIDSLDSEQAIAEHSALAVEPVMSSGSLRYLQTNGVSYSVSQDSQDVTIIWLMDDAVDTVFEGA